MTVRVCEREIWVPAKLEDVFQFFSDAHNLERITAPFLKFKVLTPRPIEMKVGALIDYRLRLRGIPIGWKTKILEWEPGVRFVDSQLSGPYKQWIHTHTFEERDGGTLCRDRVEYVIPGGFLEPLVYPFVRKDVESIFDYRSKVIGKLFGPGLSATSQPSLKPQVQPR